MVTKNGLLSAIAAALLLVLATGQEPAAVQPPATLALLVGINEYAPPAQGDAFDTLIGAENDVVRARKLLIEQFRFAPDSIEALVGPEATHAAIVTRFYEHLIKKAGPDTRVVFWFSGHGARIPDASGRDAAARDEGATPWDDTLVAYDSRSVAADGSYDIADDELFTLLAALRAKEVLVVTDCCHSGGVLRGDERGGVRHAGAGTKPLDLARVKAIWPAGLPAVRDDGDGDLDELSHVIQVAACGATEQAGEIDYPVGKFGTCTYYLSLALRSAGPETTWNEVVDGTFASTLGRGTRKGQRVHLVGDGRRLVMGGRGRSAPPGYACEPFGDRHLVVAAGAIHGVGVGARFDLVDYDRRQLGTAIVDRVSVSSCNAKWQGDGMLPRAAMRAAPVSFGQAEPTFRLALAEGVKRDLFSAIPHVGFAEAAAADVAIERVGEQLQLVQRDGRRGKPFAAESGEVSVAMLREHHRRTLWNSVAVRGNLPVAIEVLSATVENVARYGIPRADRMQLENGPAGTIGGLVGVSVYDEASRQGGALILVRARNHSKVDLHVAIVSVAENGEVGVLHGKERNNVVAAGGEFTKCVHLVRSAGWPEDQPMVDRYLVIATPAYADFRPFAEDRPTLTRGGEVAEALPPLLRQALGGARTRGDFEGNDAPQWGIASVDLQLVTPEMFDRLVAR
jgi:Caspase domain